MEAIAGTTRDITERIDAEEAMRRSEERFRAFVSATSDVVYVMNSDWSELRHLEGRDFIADTAEPNRDWLAKYIHPDDQPRMTSAIAEAIQTGATFELEHRVVRVDGTLGWASSRAVPLVGGNGKVLEWFGTAADVTERKNAEEALRRSEKLAATGRLAATIAHEINNPLEALTNLIYLAKSATERNAVDEYLAAAETELASSFALDQTNSRFLPRNERREPDSNRRPRGLASFRVLFPRAEQGNSDLLRNQARS